MLIERDVLISEDFAGRFADNLLLVLSLAAINDLADVLFHSALSRKESSPVLTSRNLLPGFVVAYGS
jgi:hypothetical protein